VIEEVRGGIRVGGYNEMSLEVLVKTADDAYALAAIGRWLPGLMEMQNSHGLESALADLAENLVVGSEGRVVTLSVSVAESKLGELVKSLMAGREREPD
jgi:hypothetical protein